MAAVWRDTGPRQSQPRGGNLSFVYLALGHLPQSGWGQEWKICQICSDKVLGPFIWTYTLKLFSPLVSGIQDN